MIKLFLRSIFMLGEVNPFVLQAPEKQLEFQEVVV